MIDIKTEKTIPFTEAARQLSRLLGGKKTHVSTIHRWATSGCKGIILEWIQIGGTRCTSIEALQRFFNRLSSNSNSEPAIEASRSVTARQRANERAARELKSMGV